MNKYKKICIFGFGIFGQKILAKIKKEKKILNKVNIFIIEKKNYDMLCSNVEIISSEAVTWLLFLESQNLEIDWIIPTLPLHLAGEYVQEKFIYDFFFSIKFEIYDKSRLLLNQLLKKIPNGGINKDGQIYLTCSDWTCSENCTEKIFCKKIKKINTIFIFEVIKKNIFKEFISTVIRSKQLFLGLGGYKYENLTSIIDKIYNYNYIIMISTACKCHGIINLM